MLKNVSDVTNDGKQTGLNTQDNILGIDKSQSPDMMDVRVHFDGSLEKRFGSNTQNSVIIANSSVAGFSPTGSITSNLVAFWRMDEASGDRYDSFGGNVLTDNGGVLSDGGIKNKAAIFVASNNQYLLHLNTSTLATGAVNFGISTWFYLNSTSTTIERTLISKKDNNVPSATQESQTTIGATDFEVFSNVPSIEKGAGQSFTTQSVYTISGCQLRLQRIGSPSGDVRVKLYNQSSGIPTGSALLQTNSFSLLSFSTAQTVVDFPFTSTLTLSNNTKYIVVMESDSTITPSGANHINFSTGNGDIYSGGTLVQRSSSDVWSTAVNDLYFTTYNLPQSGSEYEYWLYVNTDRLVTFRVSSSGITHDGSVQASSFGALNTSTWYNAVAYHDSANGLLAVGVNLSMNSSAYTSGVRSGSAPFTVGAISNGASAFFDGRIDETGFWNRALNTTDRSNLYNAGSSNTYQSSFDNKPWASFDFGASSIRWLTVSAGTGVYASSNLGLTWVTIATDRTANYQYLDRSKNVLIATSDSYDIPLYWSGSVGTFMAMVNSNAPLARYSINFQGFLILLNSNLRKRGFFYQDENTQLTGTWASSFDIPSTQDDEITAAFVFRKNMYVSTRSLLYRISYVGGNPDFSFEKVKDWGFVSRTVKQIYVEGVGQVVAGLCWDGKTRFFDGSDDQIFSDNIEQDNSLCEFSLDNLSFAGSGPVISFAETDYNENVYKLCIAIGALSNQTTHMINYDGRAKAFYPYARQHFNTMTMAESGNKKFLMAFDRSGYCHMMDSGNLDGNTTAINEHYDSNLIFEKSPAQAQKGHQTNLFFSNTTSGKIYYFDKTNFANDFNLKETFVISGSDKKFQIHKVIDTPEEYNTYQWRITSSSGTSDPWKLQRYDHMMKGLGIGKTE